MNISLFEGEWVRLAPPDPERDAEVESAWTHDPEYLRLIDDAPARPLSPAHIKKKYEAMDKEAEKGRRPHRFALRLRADDRLIGFAQLAPAMWPHAAARITLGIASPDDRGQGYGGEVLRLLLRYAFDELSLHRLTAITNEYNPRAIRFLERAGFQVEVRQRQAIFRDGRRWDQVWLGLLREEWRG